MLDEAERIHTHYDNLKVARNAPPEVIRAAYKALAQKYHPDKHPDDPRVAEVAALINTSYQVLSHPKKRRQHDEWIARREAARFSLNLASAVAHHQAKAAAARLQAEQARKAQWQYRLLWAGKILGVLLALGVPVYWLVDDSKLAAARLAAVEHTPKPAPMYIRPARAPNRTPWPKGADYIAGYEQSNSAGLSTVEIDNTRNSSDVFAKLYKLIPGAEGVPVRYFFIPSGQSFTLKNLSPGRYDLRYRDLVDGQLARSESFDLEEIKTPNGFDHSRHSVTLYKVGNENLHTYGLSEDQF